MNPMKLNRKPMNPSNVLLLGVKNSVLAISRTNGQVFWSTKLPSGLAHQFVTLTCDESYVFAYCGGQIHALNFENWRFALV